MKAMCIQAAPVVICLNGGVLPSDVTEIKVQVIAGFHCLTWAHRDNSILWKCEPHHTFLGTQRMPAFLSQTTSLTATVQVTARLLQNTSALLSIPAVRRCRASQHLPSNVSCCYRKETCCLVAQLGTQSIELPRRTLVCRLHVSFQAPLHWCHVELARLQTLAALVVAPEPQTRERWTA